jgi:hypothetical protein
MKRILLLISTFSICSLTAFGQEPYVSPYVRYYGTDKYLAFISPKEVKELRPFKPLPDSTLPVTLSLTFVLLSKEVTKDQLLKQVISLNQDFSNKTFELSEHKTPYYQNIVADSQIRFCENFEVIEAYTDEKIDFTLSQEYARKFNQNNTNSILIIVGSLDSTAGYTQTPGYPTETDAIFIDKKFLYGTNGTIYELGKTLTHLMGSYLGLAKLWDCIDDDVFDTPLMAVEHHDHVGSWSSCYRYVLHTMPQNFMYNTYDKYLNMFTIGQKERMLNYLSYDRPHLLLSTCKTTEP